jgi:hypothetical protein
MHEIELIGLDGSNLLGFLAALGTLRVLTLAEPEEEARMRWEDAGSWRPIVLHSRIGSGEELVSVIGRHTCGEASINPAWAIADDLTLSRAAFAGHLSRVVGTAAPAERNAADYLTAFGSEAFGSGPKKEQISDTEFRTMSGAGHQHFLGTIRELARGTEEDHLSRALLQDWDYADGRPALRWDPADYRPHALRAEDPSGDPIKTMRGANRLAVEALPLFPTVPGSRALGTVGFASHDGVTEIQWPIWTDSLELKSIASLLATEEMRNGEPAVLASRGIAQVYRSRRFTEGKFRNFSPAKAML